MERDEWKSGMMVEDEQILDFISEIDEAIDKAKKTIKDYRPLLNGDRWISDREAAEFLKVSRHTLFAYRQKGLLPYVMLCGKILYRETGSGRIIATKLCTSTEVSLIIMEKATGFLFGIPAAFLILSLFGEIIHIDGDTHILVHRSAHQTVHNELTELMAIVAVDGVCQTDNHLKVVHVYVPIRIIG